VGVAKEKKEETQTVNVAKSVAVALKEAAGPLRKLTDVATAVLAWYVAQPKAMQRVITGEADDDDKAKALASFAEKMGGKKR